MRTRGRAEHLWRVSAVWRPARVTLGVLSVLVGGHFPPAAIGDEGNQPASELRIFDGGPVAPMGIYLGDTDRWDVPVGPASSRSYAGAISVDLDTDPGVLAAAWSGQGEGQLYLASGQPQDLSALAASEGALLAVMKVSQPPTRKVTLRMGCGYPCGADANITKLLRSAPRDQWVRISFDLQCFIKEGLRPDAVDTSFLLLTRGKMAVSVADVRIVPNAKDKATVKCG